MEIVESQHKYDDVLESLKRGAKVLGVAALSGATGYAASKGIELILPIQEERLFEGFVVGSYTVAGGCIASEAI